MFDEFALAFDLLRFEHPTIAHMTIVKRQLAVAFPILYGCAGSALRCSDMAAMYPTIPGSDVVDVVSMM